MILPEGINLQNWANALIIDFPEDNIPLLLDENNWKQWGVDLVQCETFSLNEVPDPEPFKMWQEWARQVFFVMNNNP